MSVLLQHLRSWPAVSLITLIALFLAAFALNGVTLAYAFGGAAALIFDPMVLVAGLILGLSATRWWHAGLGIAAVVLAFQVLIESMNGELLGGIDSDDRIFMILSRMIALLTIASLVGLIARLFRRERSTQVAQRN